MPLKGYRSSILIPLGLVRSPVLAQRGVQCGTGAFMSSFASGGCISVCVRDLSFLLFVVSCCRAHFCLLLLFAVLLFVPVNAFRFLVEQQYEGGG